MDRGLRSTWRLRNKKDVAVPAKSGFDCRYADKILRGGRASSVQEEKWKE
jgi:hypothetical protein